MDHDAADSSPDLPDMDDFGRRVSSALRQLYDFEALSRHPLAAALGYDQCTKEVRAQTLRRALLATINSLRPGRKIPVDTLDWRLYRILQLRYIEGLTVDDALQKMSLQKSQFYHDQQRAIQRVADHLWQEYRLPGHSSGSGEGSGKLVPENLVRSEAGRLDEGVAREDINTGQLLEELKCILEPLAQSQGVSLSFGSRTFPTIKTVSRVPLRQAILSVISYGLELCPNAQMVISPVAGSDHLGIRICSTVPQIKVSSEEESEKQQMRLDVARQLLATLGGTLSLRCSANLWEALLTWDILASPVLLVVDDNEGFAELFRRYLAGHNWQVVGVQSIADLQAKIREVHPTVIILDVLMPQQDGWDLMISLKSDEHTRETPIIVCSVLHESEIASSLGAVSYLTKPVTEQSLLQALAPWNSLVPSRGQNIQTRV